MHFLSAALSVFERLKGAAKYSLITSRQDPGSCTSLLLSDPTAKRRLESPRLLVQKVMVYEVRNPYTLLVQMYTIVSYRQQDSKANYSYIFRSNRGLI